MMIYTTEMQASSDIDWFAIDRRGHILHVASGGGVLPPSIANDLEGVRIVAKFMRTLPDLSSDFIVDNKLDEIVSFKDKNEKERYLQDFGEMARRGFYSYDKTLVGNFEDVSYHLVCKPEISLHEDDLPKDIVAIINKTRLDQALESITEISVNMFAH